MTYRDYKDRRQMHMDFDRRHLTATPTERVARRMGQPPFILRKCRQPLGLLGCSMPAGRDGWCRIHRPRGGDVDGDSPRQVR